MNNIKLLIIESDVAFKEFENLSITLSILPD